MAGIGIGARWLGLAAALVLWLPAAAAAAGAPDELRQGPAVGASMPHPLAALDQRGEPREFRALRGKKGLILQFSRSFEW